jgi:hypothetical protein
MSAGDSFLKWEQRAARAESELRALQLSHERLRKECMDAEARAERAEADNAEVARVIDAVLEMSRDEYPEDCMHRVREMLQLARQNNSGAALLERLGALEAVAAGARAFLLDPDNSRPLRDALRAAEALKERKP